MKMYKKIIIMLFCSLVLMCSCYTDEQTYVNAKTSESSERWQITIYNQDGYTIKQFIVSQYPFIKDGTIWFSESSKYDHVYHGFFMVERVK